MRYRIRTHRFLFACSIVLVLSAAFPGCSGDGESPTTPAPQTGLSCEMVPAGSASGAVPFQIQFGATVAGGQAPFTYRWTFGDGSSTTGPNPVHIYQSPGNYTASLTVTDARSNKCTKSCSIAVTTSGSAVNCTASANPTSGPAPLGVSFTASASGGQAPYRYNWVFGDGSSASNQNTNHTYQNAGSYTAVLTVTDANSLTCQKSIVVTVTAAAALSCTASATPTVGAAPLAVSFTASASGGQAPYRYNWVFGDGASASNQNINYGYQNAGSYTATLTVTDARSATCQKSIVITVTAASVPSLSGPSSVPAGQSVLLSWTFAWPPLAASTDKVSVERSTTSASSGFAEIGQVLRSSGSSFAVINPPVGTQHYRVRAYYNAGGTSVWSGYSNVVSVTVTPVVSKTRFSNKSTYFIVSLKIDGVEQYASSPSGLPAGYYLEKEMSPGSHSYEAQYGFWNQYGGRETMYRFLGTYTQRSGITENVDFTSPSIAQLMTKFSNSGLWEAWVPGSFDRVGVRFYANGTYVAYRNGQQYGSGSYTYVSRDPNAWSVQFRIGTSNAVFYELLDWFAAPTNDPLQYFYEGP